MDFKEAKRVINFARRNGIKTMKLGDLEVTFHDAIVFPQRARTSKAQEPVAADKSIPAPAPAPTLQQINDFIYKEPDGTA